MKTLRPILLLALLAALAGAGGWWLTRPKPVEVVVHEVARGTVEATLTNTRAGEDEACQRAKMATIAGGRIEWLGVQEGDRVGHAVDHRHACAPVGRAYFPPLAHESFSVTVRLNTGAPGLESTRSATK